MTTPAQFGKKMSALAVSVATTQRRVTIAAAQTVKTATTASIRTVAPRGRLNVGKRGARVGVRYKLERDDKAVVAAFGPVQLIESDTQAHRIPKELVGRGRNRRRNTKRIFIPGVGVRASANHPGTRGQHPWEKGVAAARPHVAPAAAKEYFAPLRRMF